MATLVNRGTGSDPRWFVRWEIGVVDGAHRQKWHRLYGDFSGKPGRIKLDKERLRVEEEVAAGRDPFPPEVEKTVAALLTKWSDALTNRNASNDRSVVRAHLVSAFGRMAPKEITRKVLIAWLAKMRERREHSGQTQKHALSTLSRWFDWCLDQEVDGVLFNVVKTLSKNHRPAVVHAKRATLENDEDVAKLCAALPYPIDLAFALGNRTGARPGEIFALRLQDLDYLDKGFIIAARSWPSAGSTSGDAVPLKEDKHGAKGPKRIPAPVDAADALKLHIGRRKLQGAGPGDLLFVPLKAPRRPRETDWAGFKKEDIRDKWKAACRAAGLADEKGRPKVQWYGATRTTAATVAAKADVAIDEIATSLGHADPALTTKHYVQYQRTDFDPVLRRPMLAILGDKKSA